MQEPPNGSMKPVIKMPPQRKKQQEFLKVLGKATVLAMSHGLTKEDIKECLRGAIKGMDQVENGQDN